MKQHPLSAIFPPMTEEEFSALRADIASNGLQTPITTYEEQVLDGWHRYCACEQTGVEPRFQAFSGDDMAARKFAISGNMMRRHLDTSARALVAGKLANLPHGGDHITGKQGAKLPLAVAAAAALLNVGTRSVKDARAVIDSGDKDLLGQVESGQVSVSRAAGAVRKKRKAAKAQERKAQPPPKPRAQSDNVTYLPNRNAQITVEQWKRASPEQQRLLLEYRNPDAALNAQKAGEDSNLIDWAKWSWNPIVGCLHDCPYCYARDIAERFKADGVAVFANGFVPTLHAGRLSAPLNRYPPQSDDPREARIFTGSMSDVFGRWVPQEWIEAILGVAAEARQWEFLMLTKFPKRMAEFQIPGNVWMGTTVDCQVRVAAAEAAFEHVRAGIKWLSVEPMLEPLKFQHLDRFQLLVIGGASRSSKTPRWIPPYEWLADLMRQADDAGCAVYLKSNLYRKEVPGGARYRFTDKLPRVFDYLGRKAGEGAA
jgi:protein gp37